jgi:hypothetical protein
MNLLYVKAIHAYNVYIFYLYNIVFLKAMFFKIFKNSIVTDYPRIS